MAAMVGSEKGCEGTEMQRFGSGGMALLPWTKQILTVLWEQLRLLVQVIYYTFMSVFQMFRFEVHVRITDETGQHIQHMTSAANPTESFLFSSLFDGDNGVMVAGSSPLSTFCADVGDPFTGQSPAEALLSSLRADDLCCGLVDDFVSRTAGKDDAGIFLGHQATLKMGFPGDWNIFVSCSDSSSSNDTSEKIFKQEKVKERASSQDTSEEERSCHWSSEEEQNVEFDSEESKALWESLSKSSDPYNPFFFSACTSTNTTMGKSKSKATMSGDADLKSVNRASEEALGPRGLSIWVSRSDSESSWSSWAGSDASSPDVDKEESERLWEFFSSPHDPYNPMCFTACTLSSTSPQNPKAAPICPKTDPGPEKESSFPPSSEDDEEEQLWKSLGQKDDPYHPLNFQACLQSSPAATLQASGRNPASKAKTRKTRSEPRVTKSHSHPDTTLVPWKRAGPRAQPAPEGKKEACTRQKKVRFSPVVQVHVMRTWPFARQASRKGHWEEMARDRDRFQKRIRDTERVVGRCLTRAHREKVCAYLDGALK
ncbi:protein phosphatase 1 regulatory subunit 15B [Betta splendens]|uniref:Protein phosphatase 1 regulatory subunit 15B n=1 Tax=Betta splendens TaxID=158456 RepID=A0A6P7MTA7_BETSP|nr:protein phosphatase 1 regulatory subunit 15B [Betta splendens]